MYFKSLYIYFFTIKIIRVTENHGSITSSTLYLTYKDINKKKTKTEDIILEKTY
jgi:hypothetical protein